MKIVHLLWGLSTGGIENMLVDIANYQISECEVSFIVVNDMVDQNILQKLDKRINIFFCNRKRKSKSVLPFIKLNYFLLKNHPDIIHVHYDDLAKYVIGNWIKVRTIHNTTNDPKEKKFFKACYAISKAVQNEWKSFGESTILVENGINCSAINSEKQPHYWNDNALHFVTVSRLYIKQKGQDILFKAIAKIKRNNLINSNIIFHLVGDGLDREKLIAMSKELDICDKVVFEGNKNREWVYTNLCNFDLFIQPSRYEGFGLTVAEAMAAKVPVLASHIEGPLELMKASNQEDAPLLGKSFELENADDLAEKIIDFIQNGQQARITEQAQQHVLSSYNVKNTALQYLEEYKKVLSLPNK